jgi:apolipoprotein N-acyltransferase
LGINIKTLFYALLSGTLIFLSFPKFGSGILAWVAFVPLFHALQGKGFSQGLMTGFAAGFIACIGIFYWIAFVVVNYGYLPILAGIAVMLLLSAYLAIYVALFSAGVVYFSRREIPLIFSAPFLWTCLEYVKSHVLTGFPWANLGYSQYQYGPMIQIADVTGVFGLSFAIVFINAVVFDIFRAWQSKGQSRMLNRQILAELIAGFVLLAAVVGYGMVRTGEAKKLMAKADVMPVSLIQGNIDQSIKWHPAFQQETIHIYTSLSHQSVPAGEGLIVWPETASPFFFQDRNDMHRDIVSLARQTGDWLLFGSPSYRQEGEIIAFQNSAFLLAPDGRIDGQYDKVHLVPYGEYVPLRRFFPFISKLVVGIGDFRGGPGYEPLRMHGSHGRRRLGVMICYEGILPEAGRTYRQRGADLLVNITNDAWFGNTSAPHQHLSMTVFRAVENRLFLIRAANTGISAIVDPTGMIADRSRLFEKATVRGTIHFMNMKTFYSAYGDVFVYGCMMGLILILIISIRKRRRKE